MSKKGISHEMALNMLLSHCCVQTSGDDDSNIYLIDLCCYQARVAATPLGEGAYEVHQVELKVSTS